MTKKVKFTICCPIHEEETPSLALWSDHTFNCLGCGTSGTWKGTVTVTPNPKITDQRLSELRSRTPKA